MSSNFVTYVLTATDIASGCYLSYWYYFYPCNQPNQ